jgi:hypothetical protein
MDGDAFLLLQGRMNTKGQETGMRGMALTHLDSKLMSSCVFGIA